MRATTTATRGGRPERILAAILAAVAVASALVLSLPVGEVSAQTPAVDAKVGSAVVAEFDTGKLSVLAPGATAPTPLAQGLQHPQGVLVLPDGSIIVADYGANRLVGINGQFGHELEQIAPVDQPYGLAAANPDGSSIYVSLYAKGEVDKIDLTTRTPTKVADGLKTPGNLAVRGDVLYVTEQRGGDVLAITADGKKTPAPGATGFVGPTGVAVGPGNILFVADYGANKIVKIADDGTKTDFAPLDLPVQVATEPFAPTADQPYTIVATSLKSVLRYGPDGKPTATATADRATGIATVPAPVAAPGAATPTTRAPRSRTAVTDLDEGLTTSGKVLVLSLLIMVVAAVALTLFAVQRKGKGSVEAGFEERPLDAHSVTEAFGPCAPEEVELAESEGALRSIVTQREAAEKRVAEAERRVMLARERQMQAQRQRERERLRQPEHNGYGGTVVPFGRATAAQMNVGDLALATDAGRQALVAFVRGEIGAQTLEETWLQHGEMQAVDVVRMIGTGNDGGDYASAPQTKADRAEQRAREDIDIAGADWEHANNEIERLKEREVATMERIASARRALEECQYSRGYR